MTSNKTPKIDTAAAHAARAASARSQFEAVRENRRQRADELSTAQADLTAIHEGWEAGDDSVPAEAETLAQARVKRAARLLAAAEAQEKESGRALVNEDISLATALVPYVKAVLRVTPTVAAFRSSETTDGVEPSCVIVQTQPTATDLRTGRLSGTVDVVFARGELHKEADASAFEAAAERYDLRLSSVQAHTSEKDRAFVDVVRLKVAGLHLVVPVIEPGDLSSAANVLGYDVLDAVSKASAYRLTGVPLQGLDDGRRIGVTCEMTAPVIVSDRVHRGGDRPRQADTRRVEVEIEFTGVPAAGASWTINGTTELLIEAVKQRQSSVVDGLGRVVSAQVVQTKSVDSETGKPKGIAVRARFAVAFQTPDSLNDRPASMATAMSVPRQSRSLADPLVTDEHGEPSGAHPGARK